MYLDPGFGGMLVQILVAVVAAGGAIAFSLRKKIKKLFSKNKNNDKTNDISATNAKNAEEDIVDTIDTLGDEQDK